MLIGAGARIESKGESNWTPLHLAAQHESLEATQVNPDFMNKPILSLGTPNCWCRSRSKDKAGTLSAKSRVLSWSLIHCTSNVVYLVL